MPLQTSPNHTAGNELYLLHFLVVDAHGEQLRVAQEAERRCVAVVRVGRDIVVGRAARTVRAKRRAAAVLAFRACLATVPEEAEDTESDNDYRPERDQDNGDRTYKSVRGFDSHVGQGKTYSWTNWRRPTRRP